jgi:hypothetical protein
MASADGEVALVGSGLAALTAYATLRAGGLPAEAIAVFGPDEDPAAAWRRRAESIRQQRMRSESDGHLWPASFPGLAVREALSRRSPVPLVRTLTDSYRPSVDTFLAHVAEVRERTGWDRSLRRVHVEEVRAETGGFALDGQGRFRHVLLALGHPGLAVPPELQHDPRAVHAYEPHDYAGRVAVVGAGMAAATEWLNALAAGADVVSVRRRPPARRPLNLPRPYFSKRGLAGFRALPAERRAEALAEFSAPSYPPGRAWDEPVELAVREGRFRVEASLKGLSGESSRWMTRGRGREARTQGTSICGHIAVTEDAASRRLTPVRRPELLSGQALYGAEQVICATGFRRGYRHHGLLARLVAEQGAPAHGQWLVLDGDFTVPGLSDGRRTLAVSGVAAQWAYPAADTLVGMKAAGRAFLRRTQRCRTR